MPLQPLVPLQQIEYPDMARAMNARSLRNEEMRRNRDDIFALRANMARGILGAVQGMPDDQAQAVVNQLHEENKHLLGPAFSSEPPPSLNQLRMLSQMTASGEPEGLAPVPVIDQKSGRQVWAFPDRRGNMRPTQYEKPEEFTPINQGAGTTMMGRVTGRRGPVLPTVPDFKDGYRPPMQDIPPPIRPGLGGGPNPPGYDFANPAEADLAAQEFAANGTAMPGDPTYRQPQLPARDPSRKLFRSYAGPRPPVDQGQTDPGYVQHRSELAGAEAAAKVPAAVAQRAQEEAIRAQTQAGIDQNRANIDTAATYAQTVNKGIAERAGALEDKAQRAAGSLGLVGLPGTPEADALDRKIQAATGSLLGSLRDAGAGALGIATDPAKATADLEAIASQMLYNVPRFEGPQSNADVQFYREAAADIANPRIPPDLKIARLNSLRGILRAYMNGTRGRIATAAPMAPEQMAPTMPQPAPGASPRNPGLSGAAQAGQWMQDRRAQEVRARYQRGEIDEATARRLIEQIRGAP